MPFVLTDTDIRAVKPFTIVESLDLLVNSLDILYVPSQIKALLISNPIQKVNASWHGMRGATKHEVYVLKYRKTLTRPLISSNTLIYLVRKIQPNTPFAAFD